MKIIPAIDLLDGQAVRLQKGDYNKKTVYSDRPVEEALKFREAGFSHIHVVDLNGAKSGSFDNLPIIREIIDETGLSVQTGGGVRSLKDIELLLESGLSGVICSSMAVKSPQEWQRAVREHPRSEEHTSELQSRGHLVCRLLLEKKNYPRCRRCTWRRQCRVGDGGRCWSGRVSCGRWIRRRRLHATVCAWSDAFGRRLRLRQCRA